MNKQTHTRARVFSIEKEQSSSEIEVYRDKEIEESIETKKLSDFALNINGKTYNMVEQSVLDFIYDDLPMFNFIYEILKNNLKKNFKINKQELV